MSFSLVSGQLNNLWIGKFSIFPDDVFVHGISTRHGGVSQGALDSLNLGLHVNDKVENVKKNREKFFAGLGLKLSIGVSCQQVHGFGIAKVTKEQAGRGMYAYEDSIPGMDALTTNERALPLMLYFADCTPIMLADPIKKVIGVAHGGWKGTVKSIGRKTVELMVKEYGCRPADILAGIGPTIGACCYEVGSEVAEQFQEAFPNFAQEILTKSTDEKFHLDLAKTNKLQLMEAGLAEEKIDVANVCTACNNRQFFSYRADGGRTGRIAAVLSIR